MNRIKRIIRALRGIRSFSNIGEGTFEGGLISKLSDAAITARYTLGKFGSDVDHFALCGANDLPLGVITDEPAAAEIETNLTLLGSSGDRTLLVVASEAITYGQLVYTAADGKVQNEPAVAGTYYLVGRALMSASGDGIEFEIEPAFPIGFVVP